MWVEQDQFLKVFLSQYFYFQSIKSRAVLSADGQHYILNGSKIWISNGGIADIFTVFAKVNFVNYMLVYKQLILAIFRLQWRAKTELWRKRFLRSSLKEALVALQGFFIRLSFHQYSCCPTVYWSILTQCSFFRGPPEKKMGIKASNTAEVHFDNVKIPVANMLGGYFFLIFRCICNRFLCLFIIHPFGVL